MEELWNKIENLERRLYYAHREVRELHRSTSARVANDLKFNEKELNNIFNCPKNKNSEKFSEQASTAEEFLKSLKVICTKLIGRINNITKVRNDKKYMLLILQEAFAYGLFKEELNEIFNLLNEVKLEKLEAPQANSCAVCIQPDDSDMVSCDECSKWFHYKCAGIKDAKINGKPIEQVKWTCSNCPQPPLPAHLQFLQPIRPRMDQF